MRPPLLAALPAQTRHVKQGRHSKSRRCWYSPGGAAHGAGSSYPSTAGRGGFDDGSRMDVLREQRAPPARRQPDGTSPAGRLHWLSLLFAGVLGRQEDDCMSEALLAPNGPNSSLWVCYTKRGYPAWAISQTDPTVPTYPYCSPHGAIPREIPLKTLQMLWGRTWRYVNLGRRH